MSDTPLARLGMPSHAVKQWQRVLFARGYTQTIAHGTDNIDELEKKALKDFKLCVEKLQSDPILFRTDVPRIHALDLPCKLYR